MKVTKGKPVKISMEDVNQRLHWHDSYTYHIHHHVTKKQISIKLFLCEWLNDEDFLFNGQVGILTFENVTLYKPSLQFDAIEHEKMDFEFSTQKYIYVENLISGIKLFGYVNGIADDNRYKCLLPFELDIIADYATWEMLQTKEEQFGTDD